FLSRGSRFTLSIGHLIPWSSLKGGKNASATAEAVKNAVYKLAPSPLTTKHLTTIYPEKS
ncbi:MAG: hypothetical protein K2G40_03420, partial [Muribaculaceae bacterium]|nr:hypothetical protein [Muribaculaceae bacterium]